VTTKQRIINQAISSYNEFGTTNITSRDLAKELAMSSGNLEYHFPNKESLLLAIYKQMKKEISVLYVDSDVKYTPFKRFNNLLIELENFQKKYSFFNLDVLEISRNFPKVNDLLKRTFQIRKEQMALFYDQFIEAGYFKKEPIPGMYLRSQHTVRILITFWSSQQEILPYFETIQNKSLSVYIWDLLLPHMTEKGLNEYRNLT
jgi:AcrR family transcriptional regulator